MLQLFGGRGGNLLGEERPVPAVLGRGRPVQREAAGVPVVPSPGAVGRPCPPPGAGGSASFFQLLLPSGLALFFFFFPFFSSQFLTLHTPRLTPFVGFFFSKLPAEFYQQMFLKAWPGLQSAVQKMSTCITELGSVAE